MPKKILQIYDDKGIPDSGMVLVDPTVDCLKMMSSNFKDSLKAGYTMKEVKNESLIVSKTPDPVEEEII